MSWDACAYAWPGFKIYLDLSHGTEKREQKTCNLFCNIAAKRVAKRRWAFYHPHQTCLAPD